MVDIPQMSTSDAGLDFLSNPIDAKAASAYDWQCYLAYIMAWSAQLLQVLPTANEEGDESAAKQINNMLVRLERQMSGVQSMLRSLHG